ncbi:Pirin [Phytophthora infestans]|uniref:Pirin n=1 Tax=Phytophthora infestans TaxID=4787 RepID=A0A833SYG2_PHYIN|nr:Pirin [Phytophthora infestans]
MKASCDLVIWMTAGRGIMHSEMPKSHDPAHGLQLWVNLPKLRKMIQPRYQDVPRESVPHAFNDDKSVEALVFAGEVFGQRGPIETETPVTYVHFLLDAGAKLEYPIPSTHNALVYAISGREGPMCWSFHPATRGDRDGEGRRWCGTDGSREGQAGGDRDDWRTSQ